MTTTRRLKEAASSSPSTSHHSLCSPALPPSLPLSPTAGATPGQNRQSSRPRESPCHASAVTVRHRTTPAHHKPAPTDEEGEYECHHDQHHHRQHPSTSSLESTEAATPTAPTSSETVTRTPPLHTLSYHDGNDGGGSSERERVNPSSYRSPRDGRAQLTLRDGNSDGDLTEQGNSRASSRDEAGGTAVPSTVALVRLEGEEGEAKHTYFSTPVPPNADKSGDQGAENLVTSSRTPSSTNVPPDDEEAPSASHNRPLPPSPPPIHLTLDHPLVVFLSSLQLQGFARHLVEVHGIHDMASLSAHASSRVRVDSLLGELASRQQRDELWKGIQRWAKEAKRTAQLQRRQAAQEQRNALRQARQTRKRGRHEATPAAAEAAEASAKPSRGETNGTSDDSVSPPPLTSLQAVQPSQRAGRNDSSCDRPPAKRSSSGKEGATVPHEQQEEVFSLSQFCDEVLRRTPLNPMGSDAALPSSTRRPVSLSTSASQIMRQLSFQKTERSWRRPSRKKSSVTDGDGAVSSDGKAAPAVVSTEASEARQHPPVPLADATRIAGLCETATQRAKCKRHGDEAHAVCQQPLASSPAVTCTAVGSTAAATAIIDVDELSVSSGSASRTSSRHGHRCFSSAQDQLPSPLAAVPKAITVATETALSAHELCGAVSRWLSGADDSEPAADTPTEACVTEETRAVDAIENRPTDGTTTPSMTPTTSALYSLLLEGGGVDEVKMTAPMVSANADAAEAPGAVAADGNRVLMRPRAPPIAQRLSRVPLGAISMYGVCHEPSEEVHSEHLSSPFAEASGRCGTGAECLTDAQSGGRQGEERSSSANEEGNVREESTVKVAERENSEKLVEAEQSSPQEKPADTVSEPTAQRAPYSPTSFSSLGAVSRQHEEDHLPQHRKTSTADDENAAVPSSPAQCTANLHSSHSSHDDDDGEEAGPPYTSQSDTVERLNGVAVDDAHHQHLRRELEKQLQRFLCDYNARLRELHERHATAHGGGKYGEENVEEEEGLPIREVVLRCGRSNGVATAIRWENGSDDVRRDQPPHAEVCTPPPREQQPLECTKRSSPLEARVVLSPVNSSQTSCGSLHSVSAITVGPTTTCSQYRFAGTTASQLASTRPSRGNGAPDEPTQMKETIGSNEVAALASGDSICAGVASASLLSTSFQNDALHRLPDLSAEDGEHLATSVHTQREASSTTPFVRSLLNSQSAPLPSQPERITLACDAAVAGGILERFPTVPGTAQEPPQPFSTPRLQEPMTDNRAVAEGTAHSKCAMPTGSRLCDEGMPSSLSSENAWLDNYGAEALPAATTEALLCAKPHPFTQPIPSCSTEWRVTNSAADVNGGHVTSVLPPLSTSSGYSYSCPPAWGYDVWGGRRSIVNVDEEGEASTGEEDVVGCVESGEESSTDNVSTGGEDDPLAQRVHEVAQRAPTSLTASPVTGDGSNQIGHACGESVSPPPLGKELNRSSEPGMKEKGPLPGGHTASHPRETLVCSASMKDDDETMLADAVSHPETLLCELMQCHASGRLETLALPELRTWCNRLGLRGPGGLQAAGGRTESKDGVEETQHTEADDFNDRERATNRSSPEHHAPRGGTKRGRSETSTQSDADSWAELDSFGLDSLPFERWQRTDPLDTFSPLSLPNDTPSRADRGTLCSPPPLPARRCHRERGDSQPCSATLLLGADRSPSPPPLSVAEDAGEPSVPQSRRSPGLFLQDLVYSQADGLPSAPGSPPPFPQLPLTKGHGGATERRLRRAHHPARDAPRLEADLLRDQLRLLVVRARFQREVAPCILHRVPRVSGLPYHRVRVRDLVDVGAALTPHDLQEARQRAKAEEHAEKTRCVVAALAAETVEAIEGAQVYREKRTNRESAISGSSPAPSAAASPVPVGAVDVRGEPPSFHRGAPSEDTTPEALTSLESALLLEPTNAQAMTAAVQRDFPHVSYGYVEQLLEREGVPVQVVRYVSSAPPQRETTYSPRYDESSAGVASLHRAGGSGEETAPASPRSFAQPTHTSVNPMAVQFASPASPPLVSSQSPVRATAEQRRRENTRAFFAQRGYTSRRGWIGAGWRGGRGNRFRGGGGGRG